MGRLKLPKNGHRMTAFFILVSCTQVVLVIMVFIHTFLLH